MYFFQLQENTNSQRECQQQVIALPAHDITSGPSKEVQEKLKELEEEIGKFRSENKALAKIRSERDEVPRICYTYYQYYCFS